MSDFDSASAAGSYDIPWCMTKDEWKDAGCEQLAGQGKALWVRRNDGSLALSKPGPGQHSSTVAFNEYTASIIAHWIEVKVPRVELYFLEGRPVALSMKAGRQSLDWSQLNNDNYPELKATALSRLDALTGIIALDAFIGVGDRPDNHGNHVYAVEQKTWYSVDYADASRPEFDVHYQPCFVERVLKAQAEVDRVLCRIEKIPDGALRRLVDTPPEQFAAQDERESKLRFLLERRHTVREIVLNWCRNRSASQD